MTLRSPARTVLVAMCLALVAGALAATASATTPAKPKVDGNAAAGKAVYRANCSICHVLKAAGSGGTIGPNLDQVVLTQAKIIDIVTNGGPAMGKAAAKWSMQMMGYKKVLTTAQIQNVAAFEATAAKKS
ncbi:MAG: cytochrome c [Actinomycetes bacterium]